LALLSAVEVSFHFLYKAASMGQANGGKRRWWLRRLWDVNPRARRRMGDGRMGGGKMGDGLVVGGRMGAGLFICLSF
jgi:hypothetical protein